ncbi:hypothetical protein [Nonomuraea dietziae]|uniref:hypothetical protein n=1 Tax=Nonomuraea dietziae TaxID=65515 RepID=UPI0031DFD73D
MAEAVSAASAAGLRVLTTTGVEAEQNLVYAGLHQLLYPVRAGVDTLPAPQRDALRSALGLAEAAEPSVYLVGLATLTLLAEAAAVRSLLVVAEDAHWLDPRQCRRPRLRGAPDRVRAHRHGRDAPGR